MSKLYYVGSDVSDEYLQHWKYIKREPKPGGGYRYYYKDTDFEDAKIERQRAQDNYDRAKKHSRDIDNFVNYYQAQLDKRNNGDKRATDNNKNLKGWKKDQKKAAENVAITYRKLKSIDKTYQRGLKAYNSSKGHKVADLLNNADAFIRKAKNWLGLS